MLTETTGGPEHDGSGVGPGAELNGRFVLGERLEHGRIGTVYRALDRHRTDWAEPQQVAVLVVPSHVVRNSALLDAFERAFAAARTLRHPHIAALHDFARDGLTHYLVMEYVDGESLRNVLDSLSPETISQEEAWHVVEAVGEALVYAHHAEVVHGDVRAENVLVGPKGQVKLLFSPACLAPSSPFPLDARDDVYGLAELAYELLAGHKPAAHSIPRRARGNAGRIDGLSRRRWKALAGGLAAREDRTRTVEQLLAGLDLARRRRRSRHEPLPSRDSRAPRRGPAREPGAAVQPAPGRMLRKAVTAAAVLGAVLAVTLGVVRYGPLRIERTAAELTGRAVGAVERYAVDPVLRGLAALVESVRESGPSESPEPVPQTGAGMAPERDAGTERDDGADSVDARSPSGAEPGGPGTGEPRFEPSPGPIPEPTATASGTQADVSVSSPQPGQVEVSAPGVRGAAAGRPGSDSGEPTFAQREIVATEGQTVVPVEIRRPEPAAEEISIVWWSSAGTATAGDDYADFGRTVETLDRGERSRTVFIPITNDSLPEGRESFQVHLSRLSTTGEQRGALATAEVTIVDDDY